MRAWGALAAGDDDFGLRRLVVMGPVAVQYAILSTADVRSTLKASSSCA